MLPNQYYESDDDYLAALVDAMRPEYRAIRDAGFVVQLDCPDLAAGMQSFHTDLPRVRREVGRRIAALNAATDDIPPEALRLHVCWGNYEGPHLRDIALASIIDLLLTARPAALVIEAANPRHEHEWAVFEDVALPDGKVLVPGVIDSTCNFVEHPELVAQRIVRYASVVGRENVIAGADCGFSTYAGRPSVVPSIAYAKLAALCEGARLASEILWA